MAWMAKPSGPYTLPSDEAYANLVEMYLIMSLYNYTDEAKAAVCGNSYGESGLNPWRWQSDTYNTSRGYGLFQYTPATKYLNNETVKASSYYGPNLSVSERTSGAKEEDGAAQLFSVLDNTIGAWVSTGWRSYWDKEQYPNEWAEWQDILYRWGSNSRVTQEQFAKITDLRAATFVFLACFEGPGSIHIDTRHEFAETIYAIMAGKPPQPPGPGPSPRRKKGMPVWMMTRYF